MTPLPYCYPSGLFIKLHTEEACCFMQQIIKKIQHQIMKAMGKLCKLIGKKVIDFNIDENLALCQVLVSACLCR